MKNTDVIVSAQVPRTVAERLRHEARQNDRSTSGQLRAVLKDWFGRQATADNRHGA
jgi:hypothetical protein